MYALLIFNIFALYGAMRALSIDAIPMCIFGIVWCAAGLWAFREDEQTDGPWEDDLPSIALDNYNALHDNSPSREG